MGFPSRVFIEDLSVNSFGPNITLLDLDRNFFADWVVLANVNFEGTFFLISFPQPPNSSPSDNNTHPQINTPSPLPPDTTKKTPFEAVNRFLIFEAREF